MSRIITIEVDPSVADIVRHLATELAPLLAAGDPFEYTVRYTRDGKAFCESRRNTQIDLGRHRARPIARIGT